MSARVSIGLPVYNGENFLAAAIESVLAQTFGDFCLVISDNASTDRTEEICRRYARQDARLEYHRAAVNGGIVWNFNQVFRLSSSEYFMWFAHDDLLGPTYVERCLEVLESDASVVLCFSAYHVIDASGQLVDGVRQSRLRMDSADPVARFREGIRLEHLCEAWHGLTRAAAMRRTPLYSPYADYDRVLIAELGLYGRLVQLSDALFFDRDHVQRFHVQYGARLQRTRANDPRYANALVLPHFRQWGLLWSAVRRAGLPVRDQARCLWELIKWAMAYRRRLVTDVDVIARETLRRMAGRPSS
jgi:glycosyltransferase involved in cell wall biosynthesis